ncbi:MAG: hypothetical protein AB7O24_14110 [Kofleriaceae bacterium]
MKTHTAALFTTLAALTSSAFAQGAPDPRLPKEIQPMYAMVGEWKAQNAQGTFGGQKRKVEFTVSCAPTAGGFGILCHSKFDIEGMGRVEGTDLFGYDATQNRYHWFAVTTRGDIHDHVAAPPSVKDRALKFVYSGTQDGKPLQEAIRMSLSADGSKIEFRNEGTVGGQQAWLLTATMVKK